MIVVMGVSKKSDEPSSELPSTLPGNQIVSEGIISDILNEHFGEAVELIGIVLLRNGPLVFADICRICNASFLAFPRDMLNAFNMYQSSSSGCDSIPPRVVRDALLVMIHHGLVSFDSGIYRLEAKEVVGRMSFPLYLNLFTSETEKDIMETVFRRGRISRQELVKQCVGGEPIVKHLIGRRFLITVDSVNERSPSPKKTSPKKDRIVVTYNSRELELEFMKQLILNYLKNNMVGELGIEIVERLLNSCITTKSKSTASLLESVSIGDISVSELHTMVRGISKNELVGELIQLQSLGYVGRKNIAVEAPSGPASKRRRAVNTKQMLSEDFEPVSTSTPSYLARIISLIDEIQDEIIHKLVVAIYGQDGARVFELLISSNQKMESVHIADVCAISREDSLKILHRFQTDGLCSAQEVPKVVSAGGATSVSGVSAMMRSVASAIWLYYVDKPKARKNLATLVFQTIINLRRRFRLEVTRQCKIEDRATVLTELEEEYLKKVHEAQDILELNAIKLVPSAVVLLTSSD